MFSFVVSVDTRIKWERFFFSFYQRDLFIQENKRTFMHVFLNVTKTFYEYGQIFAFCSNIEKNRKITLSCVQSELFLCSSAVYRDERTKKKIFFVLLKTAVFKILISWILRWITVENPSDRTQKMYEVKEMFLLIKKAWDHWGHFRFISLERE